MTVAPVVVKPLIDSNSESMMPIPAHRYGTAPKTATASQTSETTASPSVRDSSVPPGWSRRSRSPATKALAAARAKPAESRHEPSSSSTRMGSASSGPKSRRTIPVMWAKSVRRIGQRMGCGARAKRPPRARLG